MTVWYKHTFEFRDNNALSLTGGIIDSTAYVDENAFANDEYAYLNGKNEFDYTQVVEVYW